MHARPHLGWEKVSCLERCPHFRSVLIEREREVPLGFSISNVALGVGKGVLTPSHPHTLTPSHPLQG